MIKTSLFSSFSIYLQITDPTLTGCDNLLIIIIIIIIIISLGTNDYRSGDEIRPANAGTICETSKVLN